MKRHQIEPVIDVKAEPAPPVVEVSAPVDEGWQPVVDAPLDGTLIEIKDHGYARFRITRRRDQEHRCWQVVGFWSDPVTREEKPIPQDAVWRMPEGFMTPGMVV